MTETFIVHVPNATTVAVGQNGRAIPLHKHGSDWTGDITPTAGELVLIVNDRIIARYEAE